MTLIDLTLTKFNHCFVNHGSLSAYYSTFCYNEAYKRVVNITGAVLNNYKDAYFLGCEFDYNNARNPVDACDYWGSVLYAQAYALTIFDRCDFNGNGDDCFYCNDFSMTIVYQDEPLGEEFKDCYFKETACFSAISSDVSKGLAPSQITIKCHSIAQLKNALYMANSLVPCNSIVIELDPIVYEIEADWLTQENYIRSMDWRDEYHHESDNFNLGASSNIWITERYSLDVGFVPISIIGNGAEIRLTGGARNKDNHFAFIPYGGLLTVDNVTFSKFNTVFHNYGTLIANGCTFTDNVINYKSWHDGDDGGVLYGEHGSNFFINCTFNANSAGEDHTDIFNVKDSFVSFTDCDFEEFKKSFLRADSISGNSLPVFIGKATDGSTVKSPSGLKEYFDLKDSAFHSNDCFVYNNSHFDSGGTCVARLSSEQDLVNLTKIVKSNGALSLVLHIFYDGKLNLKLISGVENVVINANGHKLDVFNGDSMSIGRKSSIAFCNLSFDGYDFTLFKNEGSCTFINCSFTINTGDYIVNNEGFCAFINCTLDGNRNDENLMKNSGFLNIMSCSILNNNYDEDGVIYNKAALFYVLIPL